MTFSFSRYGLGGREQALERFGEILPGAASWTLLVGMVVLTIWQPFVAAALIIAFNLYWLLRLLYLTLFLALSYARLSIERGTDWLARAREVDALASALPTTAQRTIGQRFSAWIHRRARQRLDRSGVRPPALEAIHHVVIFPVAKEPREVFEASVRSLLTQSFPPRRILVVLALEERSPASVKEAARAVQAACAPQLLDCLVVTHPDGVPGEARVKGANATYAAQTAERYLTERGVPLAHVVASCFDADTVVHPQYIACLTYHFMSCPARTRASFQPIPVYHNNIWDVPGFARVLDVGSSFFQLVEATDPGKLVTFSSHSMSFQALVEVGYWPVDMISDDSAIFWKALIHYDGDYRVVPMYVTVSMDVVASSSWRATLVNVYKQKRRWAWGVENFPIVLRAFLRAKAIPLRTRLAHLWKLFEGHVAWATWPLLLGVISWLPALAAGREFSSSVVYYTAPRITVTIFNLASIGLLTTILLSLCLLPPAPVKRPWLKKLGHMFEWLMVPVIAIGLSALPALDAQTRLLFGRYMEFWVIEKRRGSS